MKKTFKNLLVIIAIFFIFALYLHFERKIKRYEFSAVKIGTITNIVIYSYENQGKVESICNKCLRQIDKLSKTFNAHSGNSLISKVNKFASEKPVKVNTDFENVFYKAKKIFDITDGAFDPGVLPLLKLWHLFEFGNSEIKIPAKFEVDNVLKYSSIRYVDLKNGRVIFLKKGVELDFGGIAKGYIIDKVSEILEKDSCVIAAIVNIGGDLKVVNKNEKMFPFFRIAVKSPDKNENFLGVVRISKGAIVTSGSYERFKKKKGVLYSHIIDPRSGFPIRNNVLSVTVVGSNAVECDALATSFMVLGVENSKRIAKKENVKVLFAVKKRKNGVKLISVNGFALENE